MDGLRWKLLPHCRTPLSQFYLLLFLSVSHWPLESLYRLRHPRCAPQSSVDGLEDMEVSPYHPTSNHIELFFQFLLISSFTLLQRKCRTQLLILVIHGGHILDSGGGDPGGKEGDTATLASVLERVARAHFQAAADSMLVRLVPCPSVCADAFSLVSK